MPFLAHPQLMDYENAEKRRHPAIFREVPSSAQLGPIRLDRIYLAQLRESAGGSRYVELEQAFICLRDQLATLRTLDAGWDGYHAPSPSAVAFESAQAGLEVLRTLNVRPTAIMPSADGGIGICFTEPQRYAHIEFENTGDVWILMYGPEGVPESWQLASNDAESLKRAWEQIGAHLQR